MSLWESQSCLMPASPSTYYPAQKGWKYLWELIRIKPWSAAELACFCDAFSSLAWAGMCLCCVPVEVLSFESPHWELGADAQAEQSNELDKGDKAGNTPWVSCLNVQCSPFLYPHKNSRKCPAEVFPSLSGSGSAPGFSKSSLLGTCNCLKYLNLPVTLRGCLQRGRNPKASLPVLHFGSSSKITSQLSQA